MISNTIVDVATRLHGLLAYVAENEDEEVQTQQKVVIGDILVAMLTEVLNPIYAEHPDVRPPELRRRGG